MSITLSLQTLRKGTKYESYRITLPKSIIQAHNLQNKKFKLEIKDKKIVLVPC